MEPGTQLDRLQETYPDAKYYLDWDTPFHLVLATILSAQCTDVTVNKTTPALFARFRDPQDVLDASVDEIERLIAPVTYAKSKASYIKKTCGALVKEFGGIIPREIDELVKLAGVGRKTANAIQQNAFGIVNGIVVDTHVIRVSRCLGWTTEKDPGRIERGLMRIFPEDRWKALPHVLKSHGQRTCTARAPRCSACVLRESCPSAEML